jgi:hypothetical protein
MLLHQSESQQVKVLLLACIENYIILTLYSRAVANSPPGPGVAAIVAGTLLSAAKDRWIAVLVN